MSADDSEDGIAVVDFANPQGFTPEQVQQLAPNLSVVGGVMAAFQAMETPPQAALNTAAILLATIIVRGFKPPAHDALCAKVSEILRTNVALMSARVDHGAGMGPAQGSA